MITKEDIEKIAKLSRLHLPEGEAESLSTEIEAILDYVKQVENISGDVQTELPTLRNVFREDTVTHTAGEYTGAILANAPATQGSLLKVKKIL